ncbi:zinc finger protein 628-like [Sitophilus oryzae]|uniref:Zinc finger protein 628-like n=1 Tax=Sitophilus oryzae TaxID=7048 RepID=A0A6J2YSL8_SITOR|nr:zinc finger protein 628-like [Sitophilus oryzae]
MNIAGKSYGEYNDVHFQATWTPFIFSIKLYIHQQRDHIFLIVILGVLAGLPVRCNKCDRTYKNYLTMKVHQRQDCGREKTYSCTVCNKLFRRQYQLKVHSVSHHICVNCPNCHKKYKNTNTLSVHMSQDCGKERQFSCPCCPLSFKRKSHLKGHMFNKHRDFLNRIVDSPPNSKNEQN